MNPDGDENQNNLNGVPNADPTQQAIFTPAQTPVPEPPRPAQNSSAIVGSVVEPASTGLSHQYTVNEGDIIIKTRKPRVKNKKRLIIVSALVVFVVLALCGFFVSQSGIDETSRRETQEIIWRFNGEAYEDFLDIYDTIIGFQPHLSMNREATVLYPLNQQVLASLNGMLERTQERYNMVQINQRKSLTGDEQKIYKTMQKEVEDTLQTFGANLELLSDFYKAFVLPIMTSAESGSMKLRCTQTPEMSTLLQSENRNVAVAAEQYYELYCMAVQSNIDFSADEAAEKLQNLTYDKAQSAVQVLNKCLLVADYAHSSENNIELLLEELSK